MERNHIYSVPYSITHFFQCRIALMQICLAPLEFKTKGWLPTRGARVGKSNMYELGLGNRTCGS